MRKSVRSLAVFGAACVLCFVTACERESRPAAGSQAAAGVNRAAEGGGLPGDPVYTVTLKDRDFEFVGMELEAAIQGANMRIVNKLDVSKAVTARGGEFPPYQVYQFCNLTEGTKVFRKIMNFGAFIPCKIFIYAQGSDVVVGTYLPTHALSHLPHDGEAAKVVQNIEKQMLGIIGSLADQ